MSQSWSEALESVRELEGFERLPTSTILALMEQVTLDAPNLVLMDLTSEIGFAVPSDMKRAMNRSRMCFG